MKCIDEMITQVGAMIHKAYAEGYDAGYSEGSKIVSNALITATKRAVETPQEKRDRIVEQAKADVEELGKEARAYKLLRTKFVINREKRTVACLLERFDLGYIKERGIAKCAPDDCFNVHIGKAIALRRALGLEVPAEYLKAPQPTEVRVGDVIERTGVFARNQGLRTITAIESNEIYPGEKFFRTIEGDGGTVESKVVRIVDDSREGVTQ